MGGSGRDSVRVLSFSTTHSAAAVRLQFKSCRRFELANDCDWSHNFWVQNQVEKSSLFRIWSQSAFENSLGRTDRQSISSRRAASIQILSSIRTRQ